MTTGSEHRAPRAGVWAWLVPLLGGILVFSAVLATTPPGFQALGDVLFGQPRGPFASAAAYAIGAAGTLGLLTLLLLAAICWLVQRVTSA